MTATDKSLLFKNKKEKQNKNHTHASKHSDRDVQFTHKHTVCNSTLSDTVPNGEERGWLNKTQETLQLSLTDNNKKSLKIWGRLTF